MKGNHCDCSLCKSALKGRSYILYQEAAEFLTVHLNTVRNYILEGKFRAVSLGSGNKDRRIIYTSFHEFICGLESQEVIETVSSLQPQSLQRIPIRRRVLSSGL